MILVECEREVAMFCQARREISTVGLDTPANQIKTSFLVNITITIVIIIKNIKMIMSGAHLIVAAVFLELCIKSSPSLEHQSFKYFEERLEHISTFI